MAKKNTQVAATTTEKRDMAAEVTAKIIEALEAGTAPWVRPWKSGVGASAGMALPSNALTGRTYRGVNVLILWTASASKGYSDSRWVTFNQARELGGTVRKGEKATAICFWKWLVKDEGLATEKRIPILRTFSVFNVAQCEGLDLEVAQPVDHVAGAADKLAERHGVVVHRGGDRAFFSPSTDAITVPALEAFSDAANYEATLLHELIHWTGSEKRIVRPFGKRFGDEAYAAEELVAELGAAFACARLGVVGELQHAEYIAAWIKVLRADKYAVFTASREAEKAVAFLMPEEEANEGEEEAA